MTFEFCWNAGQPQGRAAGSNMAGQGKAGAFRSRVRKPRVLGKAHSQKS